MCKDIEVKKVTVTYSDRGRPFTALQDVSFRIEPGEFVSIIGSSGCGKSTRSCGRRENSRFPLRHSAHCLHSLRHSATSHVSRKFGARDISGHVLAGSHGHARRRFFHRQTSYRLSSGFKRAAAQDGFSCHVASSPASHIQRLQYRAMPVVYSADLCRNDRRFNWHGLLYKVLLGLQ